MDKMAEKKEALLPPHKIWLQEYGLGWAIGKKIRPSCSCTCSMGAVDHQSEKD
jgi:hypothetical protein